MGNSYQKNNNKNKYRRYLIFGFVASKYLCVIEIESNPEHYNNGIIDLNKRP